MIRVSDTTPTHPWFDLGDVIRTSIIAIEQTVAVSIFISDTASTFPGSYFASILRTFIITISSAVTIIVALV